LLAVGGSEADADSGAHAPDSHAAPRRRDPFRTLPLDFIH
jgi:hypothetical protein